MLNKAIKFASQIKSDKYRLCAIITDKKDNILSIGYNSYIKTHPRQAYYAEKTGNSHRIFLHAELDALVKIPYGLVPSSIFIARVSKNKKPLLAKPCEICLMAIQDAGIKNIYYTR
jgi:deoxycytidylate deaminase